MSPKLVALPLCMLVAACGLLADNPQDSRRDAENWLLKQWPGMRQHAIEISKLCSRYPEILVWGGEIPRVGNHNDPQVEALFRQAMKGSGAMMVRCMNGRVLVHMGSSAEILSKKVGSTIQYDFAYQYSVEGFPAAPSCSKDGVFTDLSGGCAESIGGDWYSTVRWNYLE